MKRKLGFMLLAAALTLSACGGSGTTTDSENSSAAQSEKSGGNSGFDAQGADIIRIGGLGPLTGEVATYGVSTTNGIKMALEEVNEAGGIDGHEIEFLLEDEKGDPTEAVNALHKLMDEEIVALIGDVTSGPTNVVAEETQDSGLPMITPTGTQANLTEGRPNVFRACFIDPYQGTILGQFAKEEFDAKTAAILSNSSSDYSDGLAEAFKKEAEARGIEIVAHEKYGSTDKDFSAQLTTIAGKKPDVLIVPDYYEKNALILQQAKDAGIDCPILGGDGWDGTLQQLGADTALAKNVYFTNHYAVDSQDEKVKSFVENYTKKYGESPTAFSALGYDAAHMLVEAIKQAGSTDADAIVNAMKALQYSGVTGAMTFDENNNPVKAVSIITMQEGIYSFYKTVERSE